MKFTASAVELYFNDCNDLLNEKAKIPIAGQGNSKVNFKSGAHNGGIKASFDENGKWISPDVARKLAIEAAKNK